MSSMTMMLDQLETRVEKLEREVGSLYILLVQRQQEKQQQIMQQIVNHMMKGSGHLRSISSTRPSSTILRFAFSSTQRQLFMTLSPPRVYPITGPLRSWISDSFQWILVEGDPSLSPLSDRKSVDMAPSPMFMSRHRLESRHNTAREDPPRHHNVVNRLYPRRAKRLHPQSELEPARASIRYLPVPPSFASRPPSASAAAPYLQLECLHETAKSTVPLAQRIECAWRNAHKRKRHH